ncbi:hypothetical protein KSP35_20945 [Aquihabitans sp. G128]|uniref:hypothetical protein n=1 Tax=Aquihabitans sp. G128 TaxID=2849779 RepID=UPI001C2442D9|nr:hypothetical protein [Aquihabitans sp. G128]QXC60760.1 hypothetical protein KSP35_20945 [Aquihabitans sp. G128]
MRRSILVPVAALALLLAACGSSSSDGAAETTTTKAKAATTSTAPKATTTTAPADPEAVCEPYTAVLDLYGSLEPIATGEHDGQVAADAEWAKAIATLEDLDGGADADLGTALATLGKLSFQVTEDATGAPSEAELASAFAQLETSYGSTCGTAKECPAPETLEAEGYTCDSEGNLTPVDEGSGTTEPAVTTTTGLKVDECPAPETLEAEGYTCDSEGNLTPIPGAQGGQVEECPAPEVLEAEGFTCDDEGNLTPAG